MENEKTIENDFDKAVEFIVKSEFNKNLNKCLDVVKELEERDEEIELGFSEKCISNCALGKQKTAYGYVWKQELKGSDK